MLPKLKILNSFLFLLLFQISAFAATDKYRVIMVDDPATTMRIGWNQISGNNPVLYYGTVDHGTNTGAYTNSKTPDRTISFRGMNNQFVRLSNLSPNTTYYFVIGDSQGTSARYWFRTTPNDNSRLSFIAGGDSRNNRDVRQDANLLVSKLKPHAVFFGGDMINSDVSAEWEDWFDDWQMTISADGRIIPIVPARGNHEAASTVYNLFDTPTADSYYALNFGNNLIRTYTLNSEISVLGNQLTWLTNDLNSNTNTTWKMAQYHKPMRPHVASKSEGNDEYNAWAQLFFDQGVRLALDSDSHAAKVTWGLEPSTSAGNDEGFIRNDNYGTIYAGEGCWGAPLRAADDAKSWTRNSGSFNQFKLIFVAEDKIELRTIKVDNAPSVGQVSNNDPFTLPANLDVWNPSNGAVIEILPLPAGGQPQINFAAGTVTEYNSNQPVNITAEVSNIINLPAKVEFYVNGALAATDFNAPFVFSQVIADGQNNFEAKVIDNNGLSSSVNTILSIGNYTASGDTRIASGNDDVEEKISSGAMYMNSSDLEMVYDNGAQLVGLRFNNINIPPGATIDNAYIQFRSDEVNTATATLAIYAEQSAAPAVFQNTANNVSSRTRFGTAVSWSPNSWTATGQTGTAQRTNNLSSLLELIVNQNGWATGNSAVFIVEGTGASQTNNSNKRVADSYEGGSANAAQLVFTYSYTGPSVSVALDIEPDPNTQIAYASGSPVVIPVDFVSPGNPPVSIDVYDNNTYLTTLSGAPYTLNQVLSNGAHLIRMEASDSEGKMDDFEIWVFVGDFSTTNTIAITNGDDDVEEKVTDGSMYMASSDLEMVYDSYVGGNQVVGLRFQNIGIPQGAVLTNAYLQFNSDEVHTNLATLEIFAQNTSNAAPFERTTNNLTNRAKIGNSVAWSPAAWTSTNQSGANQQSPNLSAMLQTIFNKQNWNAGNSLALIVEGTGISLTNTSAKRVADSYEGGASKAAKLILTYSFTGPAPACITTTINDWNFESGWGIWNDGGSDSRRSSQDNAYATSGNYCVRLRDNDVSSYTATDNLNLSNYEDITIDFAYYVQSFDNSNEDFWLDISTNGGSTFTSVEEWNLGDEFNNNQFKTDQVTITGPFSSTTVLRFRCDASGNSDWVYLDDITITGCVNIIPNVAGNSNDHLIAITDLNPNLSEETQQENQITPQHPIAKNKEEPRNKLRAFPNPFIDVITVQTDAEEIFVFNTLGQLVMTVSKERETNQVELKMGQLLTGTYFIKAGKELIAVVKE